MNPPRSVGIQTATGDSSRGNKEAEQTQKRHPAVDVSGGEMKVPYGKEQYCIGTWNVRSGIKVSWKWSNRRRQDWTLAF